MRASPRFLRISKPLKMRVGLDLLVNNTLMMTSKSRSILLIEDDHRLAEGVCQTLRQSGFEVTWIAKGNEAQRTSVEEFDLVILDLMLPGVHGFDLLANWRKSSDVPVIILTARSDNHDKVRGLKLGSDDYMTKPFWPEELLARIQARLRRPQLRRVGGIEVGALRIDNEARTLQVEGQAVELTRVEFDILDLLASRIDQAIPRARLVEQVLDADREGNERTLDVHLSRIRKKLGEHARHIETVWGVGYRLSAKPKEKTKTTTKSEFPK